MVKVNNKNTRKRCEMCPGRNYAEKKCLGKFQGGKFSEKGVLFRGNCSGVVVFGEIIQG